MSTEELNHKTTTVMLQKYLETRNTLITLECNTANKYQHTMIQRIRSVWIFKVNKSLQIRRQYTHKRAATSCAQVVKKKGAHRARRARERDAKIEQEI